ncbi:MAG: cbb3-type cytochrome c oxidase subunit I [Anaerolineales bacterium]|nr:cbb3-type cytochrome c oxidase subunit I [Anaerolineales bacterium]MCS7247805.1 cbb3-type cytochrome c oxidase subunit I [Anaerolineales bacterium]MDW8161615.1 cbb3-type cytochrome c oxidase subunit I [Anaerolineales bacterium]MDW8446305.1 cbb3-type cytochrome c oxidase subunit I [Anaerolineales bacterium]
MKERVGVFEIGLVRGLIGMVLGVLIGLGLVSAIRALLGLPVWHAEAAWVVGGLFGTIGFMLAIGVMRDWIKWALGEETPDFPEADPRFQGWAKYLSVSYDHKVIGIQYGVTSLIVICIAGLFALIFRTELIAPGIQFLQPQDYNTIMTLHGIVMIGGMLLGVGAMSNYLVPLLIGANDMAFPRLNAFSFWINVPAVILLLGTLFMGGLETGWTGYPPLSARAPLGTQWFLLGVYFIGFSSIFGALNIIATVMKLRARGMTYFRMPIFVWTAAATALIALTATQLIGLSFQLVMFERLFGMAFFEPAKGGNPILFQHLFWFYSHPAVYVFVLTGLGVISELLPVFARKPLFGYRWVALSSFGIALVGFFVWAHHMFTSGMEPYLRVPFMYSTLLVAVPTGVKFFSWVATIWEGKLSFETPMLFVLGAISIFLLGGLSGPPNGVVATDLHLQDTYWIVGHFHATMFGGFLFPFLAAIYYWFPKMTGRMYNETLGKIHFYLMLPAFYVQSLGQLQVGLLGMRRRIADYDPALQIEFTHLLITVAGYVIALSLLIALINFAYSAVRGKVVTENVWRSRSPEWTLLPSPIPAHNYPTPIEVVGEPYDYGLAGAVYARTASAVPTRKEGEAALPSDAAAAPAD